MAKLWSGLFLICPVLCVISFVIAPWRGWWLPPNISSFGGDVDYLFNVILAITGITFVATEAVLFYALFRYAETGQRAPHIHTSHRLEFWWSVIPAGILVFIAFYQFGTWTNIKRHIPDREPIAEITARQFEWRIRYPGMDSQFGTWDDIIVTNDLHVPQDEDVVLQLRSMDVLHSFFVPNLRLKQDAVPGMTIPVWFRVDGAKLAALQRNTFDIVCAELCGWGHYKMRGRLTVEPRADFEAWLKQKDTELNSYTAKAEVSE